MFLLTMYHKHVIYSHIILPALNKHLPIILWKFQDIIYLIFDWKYKLFEQPSISWRIFALANHTYYISGFYPSSTGFDLCYKHCSTICWPFDCEWSGSHHGKLDTEPLLLCLCNDHDHIGRSQITFFCWKTEIW